MTTTGAAGAAGAKGARAMADFQPAVAFVLANEGGYEPPSPLDPGGETNFGISKRAYPDVDIKNLTAADAEAIYRRDFWRFDAVRDQTVANKILDLAVNRGMEGGIRLLQQTLTDLGCRLAVDGIWGPDTLSMVNGQAPDTLLQELRVRCVWQHHELILHSGASDALALGWFRRDVK
jgi:lysozyme family protein